jgi:hypothetical protein
MPHLLDQAAQGLLSRFRFRRQLGGVFGSALTPDPDLDVAERQVLSHRLVTGTLSAP